MSECPLGHDKDEAQPCGVCADAWQRYVRQRQAVKHQCRVCGKDCGGCTEERAYKCVWLLRHQHGDPDE